MKRSAVLLILIVIASNGFAEKKDLIILPVRANNGAPDAVVRTMGKKINEKMAKVDFFNVKKVSFAKELLDKIEKNDFNDNNCSAYFKDFMTDYVLLPEIEVNKNDGFDMINLRIKIYSKAYRSIKYSVSYGRGFNQYEKLTDAIENITGNAVSSVIRNREKIIFAKSDRYAFLTDEDMKDKRNLQKAEAYYKITRRTVNDPAHKVPETVLIDMTGGKEFRLSDHAGKVIITGIFNHDHEFLWEVRLLERIKNLFPGNIFIALGFLNMNPEDIKGFVNENKIDFPVFDAVELYENWPAFYHYRKKEKGSYHYNCIDTNFIITEDGFVGGMFKEDFQPDSCLSMRQNIEYLIRPYFKDNINVRVSEPPLTVCEAAERNDFETLKKTIVNHENEIDLFEGEYNPLLYAVKYGNTEMLKYLIGHKAKVNIRTVYKTTPLYLASRNNDAAITKIMIDAKADLSLSDTYFSPVNYAVMNDNQTILELLVAGYRNDGSFSRHAAYALKEAFEKDRKTMIKTLVENIVEKNSQADSFSRYLLKSSMQDGYFEISKYFIDNGADLFFQDESGDTAYLLSGSGKAQKTREYIKGALNELEKTKGALVLLAKEKMNYKQILAKGFKPKLNPDYKFPCSQQGKLDCFGFAAKHLVQYKYGETIDVDRFNKTYGDSWIGFHEYEFAEKSGFDARSFYGDNYFFYLLASGEPVIINYTYFYRDGSAVGHYGVAYSFDDEGVWISDSAGAKRWRMSYDKFYSDTGVGNTASGTLLYRKH